MSEEKDEKQGWTVESVNNYSIRGKLVFPERKKHSVIAMNLETVEDVNKVIEQCEIIKQEFAVEERKLKVMEVPDCKEKEV